MSKLTRADQARINGALSRGPVTTDGKARSARNAFKHGLYAKTRPGAARSALLRIEDSSAFDELVDRRTKDFRPINSFESSIVREISALEWRYDRVSAIETRHIDFQIAQETEAHRRQAGSLRGVSPLDVTALGFGKLIETTHILTFCSVELDRIQRRRQRLLNTLLSFRRSFHTLEQTEDPASFQELDRWNEPSLAELELLATPDGPAAPAAPDQPAEDLAAPAPDTAGQPGEDRPYAVHAVDGTEAIDVSPAERRPAA